MISTQRKIASALFHDMITNARIWAPIRHVAPPSASEKHEMPGRGQTASQSNAHDGLAAIVIVTE